MEIKPLKLGAESAQDALATWVIPGSKSLTNRALILAALTESKVELEGVLHSDDTRHMINALRSVGIQIRELGSHSLEVERGLKKLRSPQNAIFIGNSGTSVRFLTVFCSLIPNAVITLKGDEHMAKRPIQDLVEALRQLSVDISCPTGCPPLTIKSSNALPGGEVEMNMSKSSQYTSALMLSGAYASSPIKIHAKGDLVSLPYLRMTMKMVESFGGHIEFQEEEKIFLIHNAQYTPPPNGIYHIEPDASAASYAFAAAAVTKTTVRVPNLTTNSMQGDYEFVEVLRKMGCTVKVTESATFVTGPVGQLQGIDVDMHHISDTVMTLAAIAPLCSTPVTIRNVANIRIKETDRLKATVQELERLGQEVENGHDWLKISPKPIKPAKIECYSDHRMAMSFAILGLAVDGIIITDPKCSAKTYPGFWDDLAKYKNDLEISCKSNDGMKKPKLNPK